MRRLFTANVLLLILLASSWSLFRSGFFRVHDYTHAARIAEMTRAIADGHVPPQWSENFGYGYGMPLFLFYAPLPYYFGALVFWLTDSILFSVSSLFFLANIVTLLGGYYLGKRLYGTAAGLLLAALITLAPYRALNLFIRGAVSETWGIAASVSMLLGLVLIVQKQKQGWIVLSVSTAALLVSHNLITMIFLPFFALIVAAVFLYKKTWKQAQTAFLSSLLGVTMALYYVLPAFFEKSATQVTERILTHYFDFHLHFLYLRQFVTPFWGYGGSVWGPADDISFFLGYGMLGGMLLAIVILAKMISKSKVFEPKMFLPACSFLLAGVALLATTQKSLFIWDNLSLLEFVQFPWRFLSVAIIFLSLGVIGAVALVQSILARSVIIIVLLVALFTNARYFRPESYLDSPEQLYSADGAQIAVTMSGVLPDFLPKGFDEKTLPIVTNVVLVQPEVSDSQILVNRTQEKLVSLNPSVHEEVIFAVADFPGWQVELDGKPIEHVKTKEGLIRASIPAGQHVVGLRFLLTTIRLWANTASAVAIVVFLALIVWQERKK